MLITRSTVILLQLFWVDFLFEFVDPAVVEKACAPTLAAMAG